MTAFLTCIFHLFLICHLTAVCELVLVADNFDLAFQIINDFRLPTVSIYSAAVVKMIHKKQSNKVLQLLKNINGTLPDTDWDFIVMAAVRTLTEELQDLKTAEKFAPKLQSVGNRVEALILCGKLKAAYLEAVKSNSTGNSSNQYTIDLIQMIKAAAQKMDSKTDLDLCNKYLANYYYQQQQQQQQHHL